LLSVMVRVEVPFGKIGFCANDLTMVGGATTVTVAVLLVVPVPPSVELMVLVVLFWTPAVTPVTVTVMVQFRLAANVPPLKVKVFVPVMINDPPQDAVVPFGAVNPVGKVSVKLIPDKAVPLFGLLTTKLTVVVPFSAILLAPNDLVMVGGWMPR